MVLSKEKYGTLAMWKVDDRVLEALNGTGLEHFHHVAERLGKNQHDNKLLEALVGRYQKENHCFSLGNGSVLIGLEDVVYITGLRVKGDLVRRIDGYPIVEGDEQHMDVPGLGKVDNKALRGGSIRLGYLRDAFSEVKEENELDKYVNAYVLYLVGTVILPTSNSYVCLGYLDSICDGKFKRSAWGVAMLAHIHYCVQEVGKNLGGAMLLVMISAFEHLPDLVDSFFKPFDVSKNLPHTFPLSKDWAMHISGALANRHRHKELDYNSLLDGRVTWKPYSRFHDNNILPEEIRGDLEMKFYRGVLPHPHHNSFVANHRPDHCPEQLGFDIEVGHCPKLIDVCTNWKTLEQQWKNRECMVRPRMVNGGEDLEPQMVTDGVSPSYQQQENINTQMENDGASPSYQQENNIDNHPVESPSTSPDMSQAYPFAMSINNHSAESPPPPPDNHLAESPPFIINGVDSADNHPAESPFTPSVYNSFDTQSPPNPDQNEQVVDNHPANQSPPRSPPRVQGGDPDQNVRVVGGWNLRGKPKMAQKVEEKLRGAGVESKELKKISRSGQVRAAIQAQEIDKGKGKGKRRKN